MQYVEAGEGVQQWVRRKEEEEEEDSPQMSAVSSARAKSHQMLVVVASHVQKHARLTLIPVSSCSFLCFFFIPQTHSGNQMIYYYAFVLLFPALALLFPGLSSSLQVAMTTNWNVMLAFHPRLTSCERRLHGQTNS